MGNISATVIKIRTDGTRSHTPNSPVTMSIGIGDSYDLSTAGSGSTLYDTATDTEYTLVESVAAVAALIESSKVVALINTTNDGYGLDVALQDQHTPTVITNFNNITNQTALNGAVAKGDYDIIVDSATGAVVGSYLVLFDPASVRFSTFQVTAVVSTTLTLDTPIDFAYPDGTYVDIGTREMAVNGSVTPVVFGLRGTGSPPGVALTVDITRIIITCIAASAVSASLFGDLTKLANGLVCRKRDGAWYNIFNVKNNREIAGICYDYTPSLATNPQQGEDGFEARLTFGGQNKIGVVQRLELGEDLEFVIQDNLSGLTSLNVIAEGHIVEAPAS